MPQYMMIHDLVEENGLTIRENNLAIQHQIPIGTLVEVKWSTWFGDGACWKVHGRLWVVAHRRDCDGTPLYSISRWNDPGFAMPSRAFHGFGEDQLMPITLTREVHEGYDIIEWENDAP